MSRSYILWLKKRLIKSFIRKQNYNSFINVFKYTVNKIFFLSSNDVRLLLFVQLDNMRMPGVPVRQSQKMFRQDKVIRGGTSLVTFILLLIFSTVSLIPDEADAQTVPSKRETQDALETVSTFLGTETGAAWLSSLVKNQEKGPITTDELMQAVLSVTEENGTVWRAATTLRSALASQTLSAGNFKSSLESEGDDWSHVIADMEKHDDIICLYRKDAEAKMRKSSDWRKLLNNVYPGYTVHLALDSGNKNVICLKKIDVPSSETTESTRSTVPCNQESTVTNSQSTKLSEDPSFQPVKAGITPATEKFINDWSQSAVREETSTPLYENPQKGIIEGNDLDEEGIEDNNSREKLIEASNGSVKALSGHDCAEILDEMPEEMEKSQPVIKISEYLKSEILSPIEIRSSAAERLPEMRSHVLNFYALLPVIPVVEDFLITPPMEEVRSPSYTRKILRYPKSTVRISAEPLNDSQNKRRSSNHILTRNCSEQKKFKPLSSAALGYLASKNQRPKANLPRRGSWFHKNMREDPSEVKILKNLQYFNSILLDSPLDSYAPDLGASIRFDPEKTVRSSKYIPKKLPSFLLTDFSRALQILAEKELDNINLRVLSGPGEAVTILDAPKGSLGAQSERSNSLKDILDGRKDFRGEKSQRFLKDDTEESLETEINEIEAKVGKVERHVPEEERFSASAVEPETNLEETMIIENGISGLNNTTEIVRTANDILNGEKKP